MSTALVPAAAGGDDSQARDGLNTAPTNHVQPGEESRGTPVNRKREWQQKYQADLSRHGPEDPGEVEAGAVEALRSAKVARVGMGEGERPGGHFGKAHRELDPQSAPVVLRPAAVHAKGVGGLGPTSGLPASITASGLHSTAQHARAGFVPASGNKVYMDGLLAHLQSGRPPPVPDVAEKAAEPVDYEMSPDCLGAKKTTRHTRRGPMDEMRQLVRILVKIIPQSLPHLATTEDGGGNRISEDQIKYYLDKTLGQAPRPDWGLPRGWGQYLAVLFEWATGRQFSEDEARQCAKRLPGRSWEAVESVLHQFSLRPHTWRLPLQRGSESVDGLWLLTDDSKAAQRPAVEEEHAKPKKPRMTLPNLSKADTLPEVDVWKLVLHLVKIAVNKHGTTPAHLRESLQSTKREVREVVEKSLAVPAGPLASPLPASSPAPTLLSSQLPPSQMLAGINSIDLQSLLNSHGGGLQLAQLQQQQQQQQSAIPVSGLNLANLPRSGGMLSASNLSGLTPQALGGITALQSPATSLLLNRQVVLPSPQGAFTQVQPQQQQVPIQPASSNPPPAQPLVEGTGGTTATDSKAAHAKQADGVKAEEGNSAGHQQEKNPTNAAGSATQPQAQVGGVAMLGAPVANNSSSPKSTNLTADISTGGLMPLLNYSCYGANPALASEGDAKAASGAGADASQQQQNNLAFAGLYANQFRSGGIPSLQLAGGQLVYHADLGGQLQQVQGLGQLQGLSQLQAQNPMSMLGTQPVLLALHQPGLSFAGPQMVGNNVIGGASQGQQGVQQLMTIPAGTNPN